MILYREFHSHFVSNFTAGSFDQKGNNNDVWLGLAYLSRNVQEAGVMLEHQGGENS
jgi:hypothetical protein